MRIYIVLSGLNKCIMKISILLPILIVIISISCTKTNRYNDDEYFNLEYHDNDQGFANPADLAKALPIKFDGYKAVIEPREPFLLYAGEYSGHITSSGVTIDYIGDDGNKFQLYVLHIKKRINPDNFEPPWDKNIYIMLKGLPIYYIKLKSQNGYTYNMGYGNIKIVVTRTNEIALEELIGKIKFELLAEFAELD